MQIVTDSGTDVSMVPGALEEFPIHVVPLVVTLDGKSYREGVDIEPLIEKYGHGRKLFEIIVQKVSEKLTEHVTTTPPPLHTAEDGRGAVHYQEAGTGNSTRTVPSSSLNT